MRSFGIAVALLTLAAAAAVPAAAQAPGKFTPPRTPWGEPDETRKRLGRCPRSLRPWGKPHYLAFDGMRHEFSPLLWG